MNVNAMLQKRSLLLHQVLLLCVMRKTTGGSDESRSTTASEAEQRRTAVSGLSGAAETSLEAALSDRSPRGSRRDLKGRTLSAALRPSFLSLALRPPAPGRHFSRVEGSDPPSPLGGQPQPCAALPPRRLRLRALRRRRARSRPAGVAALPRRSQRQLGQRQAVHAVQPDREQQRTSAAAAAAHRCIAADTRRQAEPWPFLAFHVCPEWEFTETLGLLR